MTSIQLTLPFPPEEEWRDVPGHEGKYQASNNGGIRNIKTGRTLVGGAIPTGHRHIGMWINGKRVNIYIHQLVMLAFVGKPPDGMEINHKNGKPSDNRLDNLEYVTHRQNIQHSFDVLGRKGVRKSALNDDNVREIRCIYAKGNTTLKKLAEKFNVHITSIHAIVHRSSWKYVE